MIALVLSLWLSVAPASEVLFQDTGSEAPWGPGDRPWVSPLELEGLAAYHRYQRVAYVGLPFFVSGIALGSWGIWAFEVGRINGDEQTFALAGGAVLATGGAGAMTWGSYTAVQRLYAGDPPFWGSAAGTVGYGLLAISAGCYVAGIVGFFFHPVIGAGLWATGAVGTAASGVPSVFQTALNPILRRKWEDAHTVVLVLPDLDPRAPGVKLAARF